MLEVRGLCAGYGAVPVLNGLDMTVGDGEIVAVLGANGVGKTTLNNTICGLLRPTAGTVVFAGSGITRTACEHIVAAGLIQVPEGRRIFPNMSVA